jgi:hypothetical protein
MIKAGRRGLNPAEPAAADDFLPRDGYLWVAAEDVGMWQLGGDVFLAGVDKFGVRRGVGDLRDVL